MSEEATVSPVKESMTAPSRPENTQSFESDDEKKERKGKFKLQEGTISRLINVILTVVEKAVPDLKGKLVLSPLECELVDEMATAPVEKMLRKAGVESSTIEILAVLAIILTPRIFAVIDVVQKKNKDKEAMKGVKVNPDPKDLKKQESLDKK